MTVARHREAPAVAWQATVGKSGAVGLHLMAPLPLLALLLFSVSQAHVNYLDQYA